MKQKKELNIEIGDRVRQAREKSGLTQEQFAEMIDKTPQFVSDLERGVCGVSLETLRAICEKLHISSDSLLFSRRGQCDGKIDELTNTFKLMTDAQFYVMKELTNTFLRACSAVESEKIR